MTELSILLHPDPRLKKISNQVTNIDESIKKLCLDMIDTMYNNSGVSFPFFPSSHKSMSDKAARVHCSPSGALLNNLFMFIVHKHRITCYCGLLLRLSFSTHFSYKSVSTPCIGLLPH